MPHRAAAVKGQIAGGGDPAVFLRHARQTAVMAVFVRVYNAGASRGLMLAILSRR